MERVQWYNKRGKRGGFYTRKFDRAGYWKDREDQHKEQVAREFELRFPKAIAITNHIARQMGLDPFEIMSPNGTRGVAKLSLARQVAAYFAHTELGWNHASIGRIFRRDRKNVSYAISRIEDRRDDEFDRWLTNLWEGFLEGEERQAASDHAVHALGRPLLSGA